MTEITTTTIPPKWWTDPTWLTLPWACPRCGLTTVGVPEVGERCPRCAYHETD